ncbi:MAG: polyprenol monophosphomannose synthase [bacterium]
MKKIIAVLPTFNEAGNIRGVVSRIRALHENVSVLVVDDDSPDGTADVVREMARADPDVHLLLRTERRGRGYAGAAGFQWALDNAFDLVVEMDADGSHPPEDVPALISAAADAGVVVASRLVPGGGEQGRAPHRKFITSLANLYIRLVLGLRVRDCTSGFRCFTRGALETVRPARLFSPGPAIVQEVLFLCALHDLRVREIPFVFRERLGGTSKLKLKTLIGSLFDVWKIRRTYLPEKHTR